MKIAIIGAGQMAKILALKARELQIESHCFAWENGAVAKEFVDVFHPISIFEKDEIVRICSECGINGVIATTELTVAIAAYVAEKVGTPCISPDTAEQITHKNWVREKLKGAAYMKQPMYAAMHDPTEVDLRQFEKFPLIVKPAGEGGKRGITVVNNPEDLELAVRTAFDSDKSHSGILIEEYLAGGKEYSVDSLSFRGKHQVIQVTQKITSGPPHCVELGHSQPAEISDELRCDVIKAVTELLELVNYENGPSHTEVKIISGQIYLIELNARPGGDHISSPLTQLSTGYDYISEIIHAAVGIQPAERGDKPFIKYAGVRFVAKQTAHLKEVFDRCDGEAWLYKKHVESEELREIDHNDCFHLNYFIYCSDEKPKF